MLVNIAPLSRTAMDKKGGSALQNYGKKLERHLDLMTPWRKRRGWTRGLAKGKLKSGEVMVVLGNEDSPEDPLYAGARTTRG